MEVNNIGDLIDLNIVDFVNYIKPQTFAQVNSIAKMLEIELGNILVQREITRRELQLLGDSRIINHLTNFYIVELKINDRLDIVREFIRLNGVK